VPATPPVPTVPRRSLAPRTADALLALGAWLVLSSVITIVQATAGAAPSPLAHLFAAGFGAVLLLRRRLPLVVLLLSALGTFAYYTLGLPTIGIALPVVGALFSAAEQGRPRWAVGTGAVVLAVSVLFRVRDDPQPLGTILGTDAMTNLGLIAAAIALGVAVRAQRVRDAQREEIARLREERARHEAALRLRAERERISRELHDSVGHSLAVISLHAGVAADAVGDGEPAASAAVREVREQAGRSLQELRAMVRLLRADDGDGPGAARLVGSLADVEALLAPARAPGLEVSGRVEVPEGALSPGVDAAAHRIVQEAVTNTLRHARASSLAVTARVGDGRLRLEVRDDGRGADRAPGDGAGLAGMRERAGLLGGELTVRTAPGEGFALDADLPARLEDGPAPR
jgi:signal transduction histidine kinase